MLPKSGLQMSVLNKRGLEKPTPLTAFGYAPRMWQEDVVACQFGDQFLAFRLPEGEEEPLGKGFDMVPQPGGAGMAWMDRPPIGNDYWTGVPAPGTRIIRWRSKELSEVPGMVQAFWGRPGHLPGLYGTQLAQAPVAGEAWTTGQPSVGFIADAGRSGKPLWRGHGIRLCIRVSHGLP